jgi:hypothetical protein
MAYNLHNIFKFIPEVINQREIYLVISLTEQCHSHRVKTDTSILKQENSMQHKNIHIIKHAKQIKPNTALSLD